LLGYRLRAACSGVPGFESLWAKEIFVLSERFTPALGPTQQILLLDGTRMYGIQASLEHIATMVIKTTFHDTELPTMRRFIVVVDPDSRLVFRRCAATSA